MTMQQQNTPLPDGYMMNAAGHLVPLKQVAEIEVMRDGLVKDIIGQALALQATMIQFKASKLNDINAFIQLATEQYNVDISSKKGNLSLMSFDGQYKIMLAVQDNLTFDEKVHAAKAIIDECLHRWTEHSDENVRALIDHAFAVDKQGNIRTQAVLGLFKLKIKDERWLQAMEALKDSLTVASSKSYIRFYQRVGDEGKFEQISLDIAGL